MNNEDQKLTTAADTGDHTTHIGRSPLSFSLAFVRENERWNFEPKEDITPYEGVRLTQLLVLSTRMFYHSDDMIGFIQEHSLQRHFRVETAEGTSDGKA